MLKRGTDILSLASKVAPLKPFTAWLMGHRVFGRMGVGVLSGGVVRMGPFLTMLICARLLGAEQFGLLATIYVFVMLVANFFGNGLQVFTMQLIADASVEGRSKESAALASAKVGLVFASAVAILALAAPGFVARYMLGTSALAELVPLAALWTFTALLNAILSGSFLGMQDDRSLFSHAMLSSLLPLLLVPLATIEWGLHGAVIAQGLAGLPAVLVSGWMLVRRAVQTQKISVGLRPLLKRFIPMATATLFWTGSILHGMAVVATAQGGFAVVGYFAIGQQLFSAASFLPSRAAVGVAPLLYKASAAGDVADLRKILRTSLATVLAYATAAAAVVALCSFYSAQLFGRDYEPASIHIAIMALAVLVSSPVFITAQYMLARDWVALWAGIEILAGMCLLGFVLLNADALPTALAWGFVLGLVIKLVLDTIAILLRGSGNEPPPRDATSEPH